MRQPDCFIVDDALVMFVWLMQWRTFFSGDSSEAICLGEERRHCCRVDNAACLLDRH
jgi:hypothetical protein